MRGKITNYNLAWFELLEKAKDRESVRNLLFCTETRTIEKLERSILAQFSNMPEEIKPKYADVIVKSNALPVNVEINRIVKQHYSKEQYLKNKLNGWEMDKKKRIWGIFSMLYQYSDELKRCYIPR